MSRDRRLGRSLTCGLLVVDSRVVVSKLVLGYGCLGNEIVVALADYPDGILRARVPIDTRWRSFGAVY